jgi:indole-3-glycerol phosphate synthase
MEARAAGASAVLLIARVLSGEQLRTLARTARSWGLGTLVEVHAEEELDTALAANPSALGVNARDLATFTIDTRGAERIISRIPSGIVVVAESGVERRGMSSGLLLRVQISSLWGRVWRVRTIRKRR